VPQLGTMIATMNGMVTQLHLAADKPGEFYGQSAQYSGGGFSDMNFKVRAVPKDAFGQWVATARQSGSALDRTSYLALCQQSSNVRPFTYRSVDANLFNAVANQQLPPCPGPDAGRAGATVPPRAER
jgi:cytochrome o ubiquinol oxidase subunit 2